MNYAQMRLPSCPQEYCLRNGCTTTDLSKLPTPMFKCGKCDIQYISHVGAKQHMIEKHSDRGKNEKRQFHNKGMVKRIIETLILDLINPLSSWATRQKC